MTNLLRQRKHRKFFRWRFADGTMSPEFLDATSGAIWFLQGVLLDKASPDELQSALERLRSQDMPRGNPNSPISIGIEFGTKKQPATTASDIKSSRSNNSHLN